MSETNKPDSGRVHTLTIRARGVLCIRHVLWHSLVPVSRLAWISIMWNTHY